jgi:hypothetical protein
MQRSSRVLAKSKPIIKTLIRLCGKCFVSLCPFYLKNFEDKLCIKLNANIRQILKNSLNFSLRRSWIFTPRFVGLQNWSRRLEKSLLL